MTAKTSKTAKATAAETSNENIIADKFGAFKDAFASLRDKIEVPAAAREFVQRAAANAAERTEKAHNGAKTVTGALENTAITLMGGYSAIVRGAIDATNANLQHYFAMVEKVAQARDFAHAVQIQADFVRESAKTNYDRARDAAEAARGFVADKTSALRAEVAKVAPFLARAA